jgi:G3E family GTPase
MKTPLTLITGSLGSGKTTLLRRILERANRRLAILMNEFGEIAVDSRVIQGEHVRIVELDGGCVCCSLSGEFEAAVREIVESVRPEAIVVETTGVAEADALVLEVESLPLVRLDGVVCIVDAHASVKFPRMGYTTKTQIEAADILLLNKTDLIEPAQLESVKEEVRRHNPRAVLHPTVRSGIDPDLLFGQEVRRRSAFQGTVPAEHHHDVEFQSFRFSSGKLLDRERFEGFLSGLPESVYRAKGFVRFAGGSHLFNYVAGRWDLEDFAAEKTELVFIGRDLAADREAILEKLSECEV